MIISEVQVVEMATGCHAIPAWLNNVQIFRKQAGRIVM
jgi:hypothetical protein